MSTSVSFHTSEGTILCRLLEADAPKTVANFVALAEGTCNWNSPAKCGPRLYDGTLIHRIIADFFIQGGDPEGTGEGGPGFTFADEIVGSPHRFDRPGMLAMANRGVDTNGSQFFITAAPADWLDRHHTIFGEVIQGMDVVRAISRRPWGFQEQPKRPIVLQSVTVHRWSEQHAQTDNGLKDFYIPANNTRVSIAA